MTAVLYIGNRNYSSWSMRGALLVRLSGIDCREEVIPLDVPEGRSRLREVSPTARVPCLHVDGERIWDSLAIAEYLHEQRPAARIWPADAAARHYARSISAEMHSSFAALRSSCPMDIRARRPRQEFPEAVLSDVQRILAIWAECRARFGAGGDYLFGEWSGADCMYAPVVTRFVTYGVDAGAEGRRYMDAVLAQPDVADWVRAAEVEPWHIDLDRLGIGGPRQAPSPGGGQAG
jgi:glutathione S-transferase